MFRAVAFTMSRMALKDACVAIGYGPQVEAGDIRYRRCDQRRLLFRCWRDRVRRIPAAKSTGADGGASSCANCELLLFKVGAWSNQMAPYLAVTYNGWRYQRRAKLEVPSRLNHQRRPARRLDRNRNVATPARTTKTSDFSGSQEGTLHSDHLAL